MPRFSQKNLRRFTHCKADHLAYSQFFLERQTPPCSLIPSWRLYHTVFLTLLQIFILLLASLFLFLLSFPQFDPFNQSNTFHSHFLSALAGCDGSIPRLRLCRFLCPLYPLPDHPGNNVFRPNIEDLELLLQVPLQIPIRFLGL